MFAKEAIYAAAENLGVSQKPTKSKPEIRRERRNKSEGVEEYLTVFAPRHNSQEFLRFLRFYSSVPSVFQVLTLAGVYFETYLSNFGKSATADELRHLFQ